MNYAIISAGEGSRLREEGILVPKPLVQLENVPMIERLIRIFIEEGAQSISIITNEINPEVADYLDFGKNVKLNIVQKTTPSSLHSFYELMPFLKGGDFCLTTVDTIFDPKEFSEYINTFRNSKDIDGLMAVTSHIDDEKPLYIQTDDELNIKGFHDTDNGGCSYISGGIYCLKPVALETLQQAHDKHTNRMRNLQRAFVADGLRLKAYPFTKILDIDHAEDIRKAEQFITEINSNTK